MEETFVNNSFPVVLVGKKNSEVFESCLEVILFREQVVSCLKRMEEENLGHVWWEDPELMRIFKILYKDGVIPLPINAVDRLRWIALLCIEVCEKENFSWGNVLVPMDYLPEGKFGEFEDRYPVSVFIDILKIRERLTRLSWETVFGR